MSEKVERFSAYLEETDGGGFLADCCPAHDGAFVRFADYEQLQRDCETEANDRDSCAEQRDQAEQRALQAEGEAERLKSAIEKAESMLPSDAAGAKSHLFGALCWDPRTELEDWEQEAAAELGAELGIKPEDD